MEYEAAPLEGVTDAVFRKNHAAFYPGTDRYYTPFISPTQNHCFTRRDLRELSPENNPDVQIVPQLLGKNAEDLIWAIRELSAMGYAEVDLNLGCPSGTVTAKKKGAGLLAFPEELDAMLDKVFSAAPCRISVKTRLGMEQPEEFPRLLEIYNKYPVCRLIIHPRTRREMYEGSVHADMFRYAEEHTALPLCYNGDLKTPEDIRRIAEDHPTVHCVMAGRGLIADPALFRKMNGGGDDISTLRAFHDRLCSEYVRVFGDRRSAMHRMKAIWAFLLPRFDGAESYRKRMIKTRRWEDFLLVTDEIFSTSCYL